MRNFLLIFFLLSCFTGYASVDTVKVPVSRMLFHDKIEKEQKLVDKLDGKEDKFLRIAGHETVSNHLTDVLYRKISMLSDWVETNDSIATNNEKVRYLTYIESLLRNFRVGVRGRTVSVVELSSLVNAFQQVLDASVLGSDLAPIVSELPYGQADIIAEVMRGASQYPVLRNLVYLKFCSLYPEKILQSMQSFVKEPFADSLVVVAAKKYPAQLYTYAQSTASPQGKLISSSTDSLVRFIVHLSKTPNALLYFPFLDNLLSGKMQMEEISLLLGDRESGYDSIGYFKLLVKTEIDYSRRMSPPLRDTPIAVFGPNGLKEMLQKKALQHFVNPINELHNENNLAVRMRAIDLLTPIDLYYVIVMGENDLYTSSYKHSFSRMLQRMGAKPRTDSLLIDVHFDYFKKFIKMAANYNKLDTFLVLMPPERSEILMKAFVANLDKTNSLEDAVDVADSYSSITRPDLRKSILGYVDWNYRKSIDEKNKQGEIIYGLLREIFLSADDSTINLTASIGIPSIYTVSNAEMQNEAGKVVQLVFFYGDEDGKLFFPSFINSFSTKNWKITPQKEWVEISSNNGRMLVFVNRPLDSDANLDDSAQVHLIAYMESLGLQPTVIIHRGHSYLLPTTIKRMPESAMVVLLGSCGGYKNLNEILDVSPDAHIISTKEIGKGDLNQPIINYLNEQLSLGNNIDWRKMWTGLSKQFETAPRDTRESWEDYVPPYKNLGAIFIKAYHKKTEQ